MSQSELDLKTLFSSWLDEKFRELTEKGSKVAYAYDKASHSIRAFEGIIATPRQLNNIQYVGAKLVKFLCACLKKHCRENSIAIPLEFENYVGDTQGGKRHHELDTEASNKKKKATAWVPKRRGGSWAILISLYITDKGRRGLRKEDIIEGAEKYCDKAFTSNPSIKEYYSAWDGIKTLVKRGLVTEFGRPKAYVITDEGAQMASVILHQEGIHSSPEKPEEMSFDNGMQVSPESSAIGSEGFTRRRSQIFEYDYSSPSRGRDQLYGSQNSGKTTRQPSYGSHGPPADSSYSFQTKNSGKSAFESEQYGISSYGNEKSPSQDSEIVLIDDDDDDDDDPAPVHAPHFARPASTSQIPALHRSSPRPTALADALADEPAYSMISPGKLPRHRSELGPPRANPYTASRVDTRGHSFTQGENQSFSNSHKSETAHDPLHDAKNKTYMGVPYSVWAPEEYDVVILLDSREVRSRTERDFFEKQISNRGTLCDVRPLSVGDVLWVARHRHTKKEVVLNYICERKRIDDLAGSIKDGRFAEQKARLKKSGTKNIHYLVEEGGLIEMPRVVDMKTALETSISMVITVSNFYMQRFKRTDDTIDWLVTMTDVLREKYQKVRLLVLKPHRVTSQDEYLRVLLAFRQKFETRKTAYECAHTFPMFQESLVKSNLMTIKEMFIKMLMSVRGISFEKALMIQRHFRTPKALIEYYIKNDGLGDAEKSSLIFDIFQAEVGAKKINKAASAAMYEAWGKPVC